jgi:hypothetical protein
MLIVVNDLLQLSSGLEFEFSRLGTLTEEHLVFKGVAGVAEKTPLELMPSTALEDLNAKISYVMAACHSLVYVEKVRGTQLDGRIFLYLLNSCLFIVVCFLFYFYSSSFSSLIL